jgi:hypothetical protein
MTQQLNYYWQGYNGYWDGIWSSSIIALAQLQITNNAEATREFLRGWNEAQLEQGNLWQTK